MLAETNMGNSTFPDHRHLRRLSIILCFVMLTLVDLDPTRGQSSLTPALDNQSATVGEVSLDLRSNMATVTETDRDNANQNSPSDKESMTSVLPRTAKQANNISISVMGISIEAPPTMDQMGGKEDSNELCLHVSSFFNKTAGTIEWKHENRKSCESPVNYQWVVELPENYGFVVTFNYVYIPSYHYHLLIYSNSVGTEWVKQRNLSRVDPMLHMKDWSGRDPLFVYHSKIKLSVLTYSAGYLAFSVTYEGFPLEMLPHSFVIRGSIQESRTVYSCTGFSALPAGITCDGIRHCINGEDEMNCPYREQGCGDWYPYRDQCLKVSFVLQLIRVSGQPVVSMPVQAEEHCRSEHGGTLALLPDREGLHIVAGLVQAAGFLNAVVGTRKVKPVSGRLKHLYRYLWQWGDAGSAVDFQNPELLKSGTSLDCAVLALLPEAMLEPVKCVLPDPPPQGFVCMRPNAAHHNHAGLTLHNLTLMAATSALESFPTKTCADGSLTQPFYPCQWPQQQDSTTTALLSPSNLPVFQCRYGHAVHYSLLCDGNQDCWDGTDEVGCLPARFPPSRDSTFTCSSQQTIPLAQRCDGKADCFDRSDEEYCYTCHSDFITCSNYGCLPYPYSQFVSSCPPVPISSISINAYPRGIVYLDGFGMFTMFDRTGDCPEGYYECRSGICIPSFLINNGERDCWDGDDEAIPVDNVLCPGYYRCQGAGICVHPRSVCDDVYHCPGKDDERFCGLQCDEGCMCEGLAFTCSLMVDPLQHLQLRYLDLSHAVNVSLENVHVMENLAFLNLSFTHIGHVVLRDMPQLRVLDLRRNSITGLASLSLQNLPRLVYLDLSDNPFLPTINSAFGSWVEAGGFLHLQTLIMMNVSLENIEENVLGALSKLEQLDIRHNPVTDIGRDSLRVLVSLKELHTDQSKLCCGYFLSSLSRCFAPVDELSSCTDLLGEDFFRVSLWCLSITAVVGNIGVLLYRLVTDRNTKSSSRSAHSILVKNLCTSDLLMGVYMVIIGSADLHFRGHYVAKEHRWTGSVACQLAGFLSLVSSEVSTLVIVLITLECVLVVCFPFSPHVHISHRAGIVLCCGIWVVGVALAAVPLVTGIEFYGMNAICIPLPITRQQFSGQGYAFAIFIILNFALFLLIGLGQTVIYHTIRNTRRAARNNKQGQDLAIARRLFLIVFTDFCCWFPIGVLGLLAYNGTPLPGYVNVWAAIFIMPLNSALNPFFYTLNGVREQWRKKKTERQTLRVVGQLETDIPGWQADSVRKVLKVCLQSSVVDREHLQRWVDIYSRPLTNAVSNSAGSEMTTIPGSATSVGHDKH